MNEDAPGLQLARRTVGAAALLGILADALFRTAWGVGVTIWVVALVAVGAALIAGRDGRVRREVAGWLAVAALFSLGFSWRGAEELRAFTIIAILMALALARMTAVRQPARSVFESEPGDMIVAGWRLAVDFVTGFIRLVFRHARLWPSGGNAGVPIARVAMAVVAAAVLVLIFGALLAGADPVFAAWIDRLRFNFEETVAHVVFAAVFTWLVGGALRGALFRRDTAGTTSTVSRWSPGALEIGVVLGSVTAVLAVFIAAQIAWISGGAEFVQSTTGLTLAEFARSGFFQLIAVAGLLLALLLAVRPAPGTNGNATRWYKRISYVLIALFGIMVISAAAKLRLYVQFYAFSMTRLYAAVAIAWLALVFIWFAATVLRDRSRRFAGGLFVSGFAVLALLYAVNPAHIVTRYNLSHPPHTGGADGIDYAYLASLGPDAVPSLLPAILRRPASADPGAQCVAAAMLHKRWGPAAAGRDWRWWNASEARARRLVRQHAEDVAERSCPGRVQGTAATRS